jgi:hypothetical protein
MNGGVVYSKKWDQNTCKLETARHVTILYKLSISSSLAQSQTLNPVLQVFTLISLQAMTNSGQWLNNLPQELDNDDFYTDNSGDIAIRLNWQ